MDILSARASDTWKYPRIVKLRDTWYELDLRHLVPRDIFYFGEYEPWESRYLRHLVTPGWVVIDVGANIGYYSALFSRAVGPEGRVYALEPAERTFATLCRTIALNGISNVFGYRLALSDSCGQSMLHQSSRHDPAQVRLIAGIGERGDEAILMTTLDRFVEEHELTRLDLVKVDIEGAERRFLAGAWQALARFRPVLMIEFNPTLLKVFDASSQELADDLRERGYVLFLPTWRGLLPLRGLPSQGRYLNVIALPSRS